MSSADQQLERQNQFSSMRIDRSDASKRAFDVDVKRTFLSINEVLSTRTQNFFETFTLGGRRTLAQQALVRNET